MHDYKQSEAAAARPDEAASPRVYVASLSDYNDGRLHGRWLDATLDPTTLESGVQAMLASSPLPEAEEYAVHDYDNFYGLRLGEYESLETIVRVARGLQRHGRAFAAWVHVMGITDADEASFRDHHLGSYPSLQDFTEGFAADLAVERYFAGLPPSLAPYCVFDAEAMIRDAVHSGELAVHDSCDQSGAVQQTDVFLAPGTV